MVLIRHDNVSESTNNLILNLEFHPNPKKTVNFLKTTRRDNYHRENIRVLVQKILSIVIIELREL